MSDKVIICYLCSWSHGHFHVYSSWWFTSELSIVSSITCFLRIFSCPLMRSCKYSSVYSLKFSLLSCFFMSLIILKSTVNSCSQFSAVVTSFYSRVSRHRVGKWNTPSLFLLLVCNYPVWSWSQQDTVTYISSIYCFS